MADGSGMARFTQVRKVSSWVIWSVLPQESSSARQALWTRPPSRPAATPFVESAPSLSFEGSEGAVAARGVGMEFASGLNQPLNKSSGIVAFNSQAKLQPCGCAKRMRRRERMRNETTSETGGRRESLDVPQSGLPMSAPVRVRRALQLRARRREGDPNSAQRLRILASAVSGRPVRSGGFSAEPPCPPPHGPLLDYP